MRLFHLQLFDYRNFSRLALSLPGGASVFVGDNAQGKTNLLEAIYLLATMRTPRAETEAQLIRWDALSQPLPGARVVGEAETRAGPLKVEVAVVGRQPADAGLAATKVARVNGVARRLFDAMGQLNAVLFTASDLDLITSGPALRRRYLDITISQADRAYLAARQRYDKMLLQRNHLLKRIREHLARPDELTFWNDELVKDGAYILWVRAQAVAQVGRLAAAAHQALAADEALRLAYQPCLSGRQPRLGQEGGLASVEDVDRQAFSDLFAQALRRNLDREVAAGMTLLGPHRDDLLFLLNGVAAAGFASRAQQRTIALALRLAEARYLLGQRGEAPILLLDDVLSEMDGRRRLCLLDAISDYEQVLITATELDRFDAGFLAQAALFHVDAGRVTPPEGSAIARTGEA